MPYAPLQEITPEKALQEAYSNRADYRSAQLAVQAAQLSRKAALAENYPSVSSQVDYGDIGPNFANSHGTVTAAASVNIPIFQGTRVRADVLAADTTLQQRSAEMEDLRGRIDQEVRSALLDLTSASELVRVAQSNRELARETLSEAQDRFTAGVTDNIEVVQAQESVSAADQAYISSLYSFNIAKVELARSVGVAEQAVKTYLGGQLKCPTKSRIDIDEKASAGRSARGGQLPSPSTGGSAISDPPRQQNARRGRRYLLGIAGCWSP